MTNKQSIIDSITKIAQKESRNLYNDIVDLMDDKRRFQLDDLLEYSTSQWLSKRNPVIVRFLETLTHNDNENYLEGGKLFKCAVAVDAIYGARNLKYVSAINLTSSAIKYSIAKSKKIIDIDNHFLSSGSFLNSSNGRKIWLANKSHFLKAYYLWPLIMNKKDKKIT